VVEGKDHFGFEGATGQVFIQGRRFSRKTQFLGSNAGFMKSGEPFVFEVVRKGRKLAFIINGTTVYKMRFATGRFGTFGFRPWRSTMQISDFSAEGELLPFPPPRTQPTDYTIPIIDLSTETRRQVVVARGTADVYQGHPTTVLMGDNKTMFAVWTYDHGGRCGPMKKSTDGGLTWSDLLPVPDNWKTVKNCPCIHRLTDPQRVERLFVLAGNGDMYQSVSEDGGKTWTPMAKNGLHCVVAPITIVLIKGDRHLAMYQQRRDGKLVICQSISSDGGLTWEPERLIAEHEAGHPCEPAVIRSPDGKQLAVLIRENTRRYNSMLITSDDEGETWSKLVELPASLTGDRHMPRYAPDGRLVIPFRDTAAESLTKGDFVAWVGTYDDIVNLREGQYRVRLLHQHGDKPWDCGYSGVECLPDGTFVATTYAVLKEGEKNSVVSVRFKTEEIDAKAKLLPKQTAVWRSGADGYHTYRIPALIVTKHGTLLAFCEGRKNSRKDHGDIDLMLKRSTDGGQTWSDQTVVYEEGDGAEITIGNPCPVVDEDTGAVWLPFCRDNRDVLVTRSTDDGLTWSKPIDITKGVKDPGWGRWYATGPGVGIQLRRGPRKGRLVIPCDHRERAKGDWMMHSHVFFSDDHGGTWQLGGSAAPHTDECQVVELSDGRLMINMRNYWGRKGKQSDRGGMRAIAWSDDGGQTWPDLQFDRTLVEPVCQARLLADPSGKGRRLLFSNPATKKDRVNMTVRLSDDEGKAWSASQVLYPGPSAYSCLAVLPDGTIGCLYERGKRDSYQTITFARFDLEWLTGEPQNIEY